MIGRKFFNRVAATVAVTGMMFTGIADVAAAAAVLNNGKVNGFINATSPSLSFTNQSRKGAPIQTASGDEYTFNAQRGETINISVDVEDGSGLSPVLVLISSQTGQQVAYNDSSNSLQYQVPTAGRYRLLVLGQNNSRGRYTLSVSGLSKGEQVSQADRVMKDVLRLKVIGCGIPNVAKITIGSQERCTRDIEAGQYVYQESSRSIKLVDQRRDLLAKKLQLTILDSCPPAGRPVVKITVPEPQDSKNYTYCANPTRFVQAGEYTYDISSDELTAVGTGSQNASSQTTDQSRQILENEYGLSVLDTCPEARNSVVVVSFPNNNGQTDTYCANPNRLFQAGEYTYNTSTRSLDPATKPQQCTVTVGGVCVVK